MVGRDLSNTLLMVRARLTVRPAGARVLTVQNLKMAPMVKNHSPSVRRKITGVFGWSEPGAPKPSRWSPAFSNRYFFHRAEKCCCTTGRCVTAFLRPPCAPASPMSRKTERSKASSKQCRFPATSILVAGQYCAGGRLFLLAARGRQDRQVVGRQLAGSVDRQRYQRVVGLWADNQQKVVIAKSLVQDPDLDHFRRSVARALCRRDRRDSRCNASAAGRRRQGGRRSSRRDRSRSWCCPTGVDPWCRDRAR